MLAEIDVGARTWRTGHYRGLAARLRQVASAQAFEVAIPAQRPVPTFAERLAVVPDFLPAHGFAALSAEAERLLAPERSFVPTARTRSWCSKARASGTW